MLRTSSSFEQYWAIFVRAHLDVATRRVQFAAMSLGLASLFAGAISKRGALVVLAPVIAWLPTWIAQRALEDSASPPPTPVMFAIAANLKMWRMTLDGTMSAEVERITAAQGRSRSRPDAPEPNMATDHTFH